MPLSSLGLLLAGTGLLLAGTGLLLVHTGLHPHGRKVRVVPVATRMEEGCRFVPAPVEGTYALG